MTGTEDDPHELDSVKISVTVTVLWKLESSLNELPKNLVSLVTKMTSAHRLSKFLCSSEMAADNCDYRKHERSDKDDNFVIFKNASFSAGSKNHLLLKNVTCSIKQGDLVGVIGKVGSGKSSFLKAIVGELEKVEGSVTVFGSRSYAPQSNWIMNMTLRDNIVFQNDFNISRYQQVVQAAQLKPDIEQLKETGGDKTEIGEKGINLSGGQKQRVSVARAVYHQADVYVFDDVLSAVDAHVGKQLFKGGVG